MRGIEPRPRRWERRILTTRPHGTTTRSLHNTHVLTLFSFLHFVFWFPRAQHNCERDLATIMRSNGNARTHGGFNTRLHCSTSSWYFALCKLNSSYNAAMLLWARSYTCGCCWYLECNGEHNTFAAINILPLMIWSPAVLGVVCGCVVGGACSNQSITHCPCGSVLIVHCYISMKRTGRAWTRTYTLHSPCWPLCWLLAMIQWMV